jgi:hypothetical protein
MMLAGLALVMTLRSARKGVQRMKLGGLTAGRHEATYKAHNANACLWEPHVHDDVRITRFEGITVPTLDKYVEQCECQGLMERQTQAPEHMVAQLAPLMAALLVAHLLPHMGSATGTAFGSTGNVGYNNPSTSTYGTSSYGG